MNDTMNKLLRFVSIADRGCSRRVTKIEICSWEIRGKLQACQAIILLLYEIQSNIRAGKLLLLSTSEKKEEVKHPTPENIRALHSQLVLSGQFLMFNRACDSYLLSIPDDRRQTTPRHICSSCVFVPRTMRV